jgi:hypothetical protein
VTPSDDPRSAALDAYLSLRQADGYKVETRTAMQAVIVRRRRLHAVLRLAGAGVAENRLVVSVDEHGDVSAVAAEPVRW